jgi:transposase
MWEVLDVLRRVQRGETKSGIERATGRTRKTIHRYVKTLLARQGVAVPYSSLHRFVVANCGFRDARRLTVRRAECAPGELAEVDFGRLGLVWDPAAQRQRVAHALLVTLVYSRHQYVYVSFSQKIPDLIAGLEEAWEFFGGVPARVVLEYVARHIFELRCPTSLCDRVAQIACTGLGARAMTAT